MDKEKWEEIKNNLLIVAELSANHNHNLNIAKKTIEAAKMAGADAIKLQTYTADTLTIDCKNEYFTLNSGTIWDGKTYYALYQEAYTPWEWHKELKEYAESIGLLFFSTPFDKTAVDFLEELDVPLYKIASFEVMDIPLIEYAASKGKPMIISTGIATLSEIEDAVEACKRVGNNQVMLLKCTSSYPARIEDANLKTMVNMRETFGVEVGLSDHTMGITVPIVAASLGARLIEKHFILDRTIGGPDATFSMEPEDFKQMVIAVREAEKAVGKIDYSMDERKKSNRIIGRSLFVVEDIKEGDIFSEDNIRSIRPGNGLSPKYYNQILGRKANKDLKRGTPLEWKYFE
ncbi:pseudaminic acid synthase [Acetobacterium malicum]|uniref:pseudaminic acid synthase n=1 Tax=Acetobacterium malicum TaxID=52692 RepID=UPI0004084624|nr:pseudaminic acid synthase [Acetobacterium dehalogenans]